MKIAAYGYQLRKEDIQVIKNMCKFITKDIIDIYDIMSFDIASSKDTLLLLYGNKAIEVSKNIICLHKVCFPDASRLNPSLGETEERLEAYQTLQKLKKVLDSGDLNTLNNQNILIKTDKLNEKSLPKLTANQVRQLERHQREQGKNQWNGITEDGKTIKITVEPSENTADINLTFAELYAVMGLVETFQVKELEIVYKPSSSNTNQ
jgi:hypothetical protein